MLLSTSMKSNKEQMIFARVDATLQARLNRAAELLDRPASQIVRESVKRELDLLARKYPQLRK
jgi:predicted transcriptional regulator